MVLARLACTLAVVIAAIAQAQIEPAPHGPDRPQPPAGTPGPWDNDVLIYRLTPRGDVTLLATFKRAGVPTLARMKDGRLIAAHQYFPEDDRAGFDKVAVRFCSDEGKTWTRPQVIRLKGLPDGMRFPFDPTLVLLPDRRIRLYFTSVRQYGPQENMPAIYSAISDKGLDYTFEPGIRFGIQDRPVIDCAVVLHQGIFHLYAPDNGRRLEHRPRDGSADAPPSGTGYHATSKDGLEFARQDDVKIEGRRRWLGNAQSDGKTITFFGTGDPGGASPTAGPPRGGLWQAVSPDGSRWRLAPLPAVPGADPGAVAATDGGWILACTGPPRPGTPSDRRSRRVPGLGEQRTPAGASEL